MGLLFRPKLPAALLPVALLGACSPGRGVELPPSVSVVVASAGGGTLREWHRGGSADSLYHWWSVTKTATALAVLELAEAGRLDLDAPVARYLPWVDELPDGGAWGRITPRMLLTHTAGVGDPGAALFGWIHHPGAPQPPEEQTVRRAAAHRSVRPRGPLPSGRPRYSNTGYVLLGALIEEVTGRPYGEAVRGLVLEPAGMTDTGVAYPQGAEGEGRLVAGTHPRFHPIALLLPLVVRDHRALVAGRREGRLWFRPVYTDYLGSTGLIGPARDAPRLAARWAERAGQSGLVAGALGVRLRLGRGLRQSTGWQWDERGFFVHRGGGPGFGAELRWYPGGIGAPAGAAAPAADGVDGGAPPAPDGLYAFAVGSDTTYPYGELLDGEVAAARAGR